MTAEWYYAKGETKHGPVTEARLRELATTGELLPTDRAWRKGTAGWVMAVTVPGLFPDDGPPPLPAGCERDTPVAPTAPRLPWGEGERVAPNPLLKYGTWGVIGAAAFALLLFLTPAAILGLWLLAVVGLFSVFWVRVVWGLTLRGRWLPVDGRPGWVEFLPGNVFKREDGLVGSYVLLPNQRFIDLFVSGHPVDSWKVLARGDDSLEVQDSTGAVRSFKKGKTLQEKQQSFFHTARTDHLPGSWLPADGSGEWVQFTDDGAVVYSDGKAGRYTVTGEEPNEVVRVKLADGSACEYRVMSLSKTQLVIVEGTQARAYHRHGHTGSAAADSAGDGIEPSKCAAEGEKAGVSVGSVLSGLWNRMTKWQCPACRSRNTEVRGSEITERRQEVMSDVRPFERNFSQSVYNVTTHEHHCRCKGCGHEWIQEEITRTRA